MSERRSFKEQMKEEMKRMGDKLTGEIDKAIADGGSTNKAISVNTGKGSRTSVSSKQRVVQRDGRTETVEERIERRSDG